MPPAFKKTRKGKTKYQQNTIIIFIPPFTKWIQKFTLLKRSRLPVKIKKKFWLLLHDQREYSNKQWYHCSEWQNSNWMCVIYEVVVVVVVVVWFILKILLSKYYAFVMNIEIECTLFAFMAEYECTINGFKRGWCWDV